MSRQSNIILTNEDNIIIDSLRHFDGNSRELLPAHHFTFTPILKKSFLKISLDEFLKLVYENESIKISQKLPEIFIGFSKGAVLGANTELGIDDENYTDEDLRKIYDYFQNLIQNIEKNKTHCKNIDKDFALIINPNEEKLQVNKFIDEYYFIKEQKNVFNSSKN